MFKHSRSEWLKAAAQLALVLAMFQVSASAQTAQQVSAGARSFAASAPAADTGVPLTGSGVAWHVLTWTTSGTVSSCSVRVDSSANGSSWTAGGAVTAQTCTSSGQAVATNVVTSYVRINFTSLSGGGTVTAVWRGYVLNPSSDTVPSLTVTSATANTCTQFDGSKSLTSTATACVVPDGWASPYIPRITGPVTLAKGTLEDDGTLPVMASAGIEVAPSQAYGISVANNASTGTTEFTMSCNDGTGKAIICDHTATTTDDTIGVAMRGFNNLPGTSGNVNLCNIGYCRVFFDNTSVAGDYAALSTITDGYLHDVGATAPTDGNPFWQVFIGGDATAARWIETVTPGQLSAAGKNGVGPVKATSLPAQYKTWKCEAGWGDGLDVVTAGAHPGAACYNSDGVTWTVTAIKCYSDNNGTTTVDVTNGSGTSLLTGVITCSNSWAAGSQSATTTIASTGYLKFSVVADGASKWVQIHVSGTK